jgi:hypothetical protein
MNSIDVRAPFVKTDIDPGPGVDAVDWRMRPRDTAMTPADRDAAADSRLA